MIRSIFLFFCFILFLGTSAYSITQFPINSCGIELDQPYNSGSGIEYVLQSNLTSNSTEDCIVISENDVKLNCQNYSITGSEFYNGVSIYSNNSVVENCNIYNFFNGIFLWGVHDNQISNVVSSNNIRGAGVGFDEKSRQNTVTNLEAENNYYGVIIYDGDNNFFKDNLLNNNLYGVYIASSDLASENNKFEGGDFRSNTQADLYLAKLEKGFGKFTLFEGVIFGLTSNIISEDPKLKKPYNYNEVKFDGNTYYDNVEELPFCFPEDLNYVCDDDAILPNYDGPELDEENPSKVQNVIAALVESGSVSLVWDPATDNIEVWGYRVFRNGVSVGTTINTYYQDLNLIADVDYNYQVQAIDTSNNVGFKSSVLTVRTLEDPNQNETNQTNLPPEEDPVDDPVIEDEPIGDTGGDSSSSSGGGFLAPYVNGSIVDTLETQGEACISKFNYESWSNCENERQTRIIKDLNGCVRVSIESRICKEGFSEEENLLLNSRRVELIKIGDGRYLVELRAGYNEIFYTTEDFEYSVFIATDRDTNIDYYGERYDYKEEGKYFFTLKRIDESNINQVYDIAGIKKAIKIGNYLTRFLVAVMFITLGVYLYYALYYKPKKKRAKMNKD